MLATVAVERFHGGPRAGQGLAFGVLPDQDGGVAADSFPASVVPHWHVIRTAGRCTGSAINARIPAHSEFASWVHRTALCV
ncbi:hypothetical protein KC219_24105, partial [Mycobacterium tuberculosis]|nr:hypothetical protein [Mycobacterium tuberculosis]